MIVLRRTGGAYADLETNLAGKREVDEFRGEMAGFQSVEEHLREERNLIAHRDKSLVEAVCILLGFFVGSGLVVFTFRRIEIVAARLRNPDGSWRRASSAGLPRSEVLAMR